MDDNILATQLASNNRPCIGESQSGDKVVCLTFKQQTLLAIIDATGHGPEAHIAAEKYAGLVARLAPMPLLELLTELNRFGQPCIGAAIGLCLIDHHHQQVEFAGIGNISAYILGANSDSFVSRDGVLGRTMRKPILQTKTLRPGDLIVLHSDGIQSRFYSQYQTSVLKQTPNQILSYIFNEFGKQHDDASCIVYRY